MYSVARDRLPPKNSYYQADSSEAIDLDYAAVETSDLIPSLTLDLSEVGFNSTQYAAGSKRFLAYAPSVPCPHISAEGSKSMPFGNTPIESYQSNGVPVFASEESAILFKPRAGTYGLQPAQGFKTFQKNISNNTCVIQFGEESENNLKITTTQKSTNSSSTSTYTVKAPGIFITVQARGGDGANGTDYALGLNSYAYSGGGGGSGAAACLYVTPFSDYSLHIYEDNMNEVCVSLEKKNNNGAVSISFSLYLKYGEAATEYRGGAGGDYAIGQDISEHISIIWVSKGVAGGNGGEYSSIDSNAASSVGKSLGKTYVWPRSTEITLPNGGSNGSPVANGTLFIPGGGGGAGSACGTGGDGQHPKSNSGGSAAKAGGGGGGGAAYQNDSSVANWASESVPGTGGSSFAYIVYG